MSQHLFPSIVAFISHQDLVLMTGTNKLFMILLLCCSDIEMTQDHKVNEHQHLHAQYVAKLLLSAAKPSAVTGVISGHRSGVVNQMIHSDSEGNFTCDSCQVNCHSMLYLLNVMSMMNTRLVKVLSLITPYLNAYIARVSMLYTSMPGLLEIR